MSQGGGPVGAFNLGAWLADGKYIVKLDSDDTFADNALPHLVDALDANPDVGFVYGQCQYHGKENRLYTPPPFNAEDFWRYNPAIGEVMFRREALDAGIVMRGFWNDGTRAYGPHDRDYCLQMIHTLGWKGLALPDVLVLHYNYRDGTASTRTRAHTQEVKSMWETYWNGRVKA
jgi:glycosyltransferase involved in cell wall biosynthesis